MNDFPPSIPTERLNEEQVKAVYDLHEQHLAELQRQTAQPTIRDMAQSLGVSEQQVLTYLQQTQVKEQAVTKDKENRWIWIAAIPASAIVFGIALLGFFFLQARHNRDGLTPIAEQPVVAGYAGGGESAAVIDTGTTMEGTAAKTAMAPEISENTTPNPAADETIAPPAESTGSTPEAAPAPTEDGSGMPAAANESYGRSSGPYKPGPDGRPEGEAGP